MALEGQNLFTKKAEKDFFHIASDEAAAQDKCAVLLAGFTRDEKNMLLDEMAFKIKNSNREQTINDWNTKCMKVNINKDVVEEWARVAKAMNDLGKKSDDSATEMMALLEAELKTVHDVMGKKWREANGKEASVRKAFAILFALVMVYELEETWLLYAATCKAQINKQFKVFGGSWKKVLHNELELLGLVQDEYDCVLEKLAVFDTHINHIEGVDIKFGYK